MMRAALALVLSLALTLLLPVAPAPALAAEVTLDTRVSVSFLDPLDAEDWREADLAHLRDLVAKLPIQANEVLVTIIKETLEIGNLLDATQGQAGYRSDRGFIVYDLTTSLKVLTLDAAEKARKAILEAYDSEPGPWGEKSVQLPSQYYPPVFKYGDFFAEGWAAAEDWPEASEAIKALEDLPIVDDAFRTDTGWPLEVYCLPYNLVDQTAPDYRVGVVFGEGKLFLGASARPTAHNVVYGFGHLFSDRFLADPVKNPSRWNEYKALRGIPADRMDSEVYHCFAEDFRVALGNAAAAEWVSSSEWGDPIDNGLADKLKAWLIELAGSGFQPPEMEELVKRWRDGLELGALAPLTNVMGIDRVPDRDWYMAGASPVPALAVARLGQSFALSREWSGSRDVSRYFIFSLDSPEGLLAFQMPEASSDQSMDHGSLSSPASFNTSYDVEDLHFFTDRRAGAVEDHSTDRPSAVTGFGLGDEGVSSASPHFSYDAGRVTSVSVSLFGTQITANPKSVQRFSVSNPVTPGQVDRVYLPVRDGLYDLTIKADGTYKHAFLVLDTPEDPWAVALAEGGRLDLGAVAADGQGNWAVAARPVSAVDGSPRLRVTLTGAADATVGNIVPVSADGLTVVGPVSPLKFNGNRFEAQVDLAQTAGPYRLRLELQEGYVLKDRGTIALLAWPEPATAPAAQAPRAFARAMVDLATTALQEHRVMDALRALVGAVNYWDTVLPGTDRVQPVSLGVYSDGVKAAREALAALTILFQNTSTQSLLDQLAIKDYLLAARQAGPFRVYGGPTLADAADHWSAQYIRPMLAKGIIKGFSDGSLRPDSPVSRLEALVMTERLAGLEAEARDSAATMSSLPYSDGGSIPAWGLGYVATAVAHDLVDVKSGRLRASEPCTRAEAAVMLVRALGPTAVQEAQGRMREKTAFVDDAAIPGTTRGYVIVAVDRGLIKGSADGKFLPTKSLSRAELSTMLNRLDGLVSSSVDSLEVSGTLTAVEGDRPAVLTVKTAGGERTVPLLMDAVVIKAGSEVGADALSAGDKLRIITDANGYAVIVESQGP
ncbi:MAG TPA: S-layer homology domain-containing protein [Bacillota bacterium]|jgi:hypothetical protein